MLHHYLNICIILIYKFIDINFKNVFYFDIASKVITTNVKQAHSAQAKHKSKS